MALFSGRFGIFKPKEGRSYGLIGAILHPRKAVENHQHRVHNRLHQHDGSYPDNGGSQSSGGSHHSSGGGGGYHDDGGDYGADEGLAIPMGANNPNRGRAAKDWVYTLPQVVTAEFGSAEIDQSGKPTGQGGIQAVLKAAGLPLAPGDQLFQVIDKTDIRAGLRPTDKGLQAIAIAQGLLKEAGLYDGPIDSKAGAGTFSALAKFNSDPALAAKMPAILQQLQAKTGNAGSGIQLTTNPAAAPTTGATAAGNEGGSGIELASPTTGTGTGASAGSSGAGIDLSAPKPAGVGAPAA